MSSKALSTHNLCIKTGKTSDNPSRIVFVAASNGSEAGNFPLDGIEDAWIFQVGYHVGYGLTGGLPDDRNSCPQGYRYGDLQSAEFFRLVATRLRTEFFLSEEIPKEVSSDWFATPKPAHMRFSDECLLKILSIEFRKACRTWDTPRGVLPCTLLCHSGGSQWCGDALELILSNPNRLIHKVLVFAPAMGLHQFMKLQQVSFDARLRSQMQLPEVVLFYHENDGKCKVKVQQDYKTFKMNHITVQHVALPGWDALNKSAYWYHCHNLPALLMETNLMQQFLQNQQPWQMKEEFGIRDILPSRGGIAFILFLSVLIAVFETSTQEKRMDQEVNELNSWSGDMIHILEKYPFILHPTHPTIWISKLFTTSAQKAFAGLHKVWLLFRNGGLLWWYGFWLSM